MTDHDDVVDLLQRAVDTAPATDDQIATIATAVRRRRTVRRTAAVVGVTAVLAVGLIAPWSARSNRVDFADTPAVPADEATWHELPPSPLDPRWGAFAAADNDGLFIWGGYATAGGGEGPRDDGAGYWNGSWAQLPDSPLAPRMRLNSAAGWIHREYWIVGGTGGTDGRTPLQDAAAFRPTGPREGQWHELPAVPEPIVGGTTVVGETMVVIAHGAGGSRAVYQLAPGDRQWDKLEQSLPPVDPAAADNSDLHLVDASGRLVVVGQGEMFTIPNGLNQGVGIEWERVPPPGGGRTFGNVRGAIADFSRETEGVLVLLSDGTYRYDFLTGEWSRIADGLRPDPPQPIPLMLTIDEVVVAVDVVNGRLHALSKSGWTELPALDGPRINASVELVNTFVPGFGDLAADDSEEVDDNEIFDNIVVWGGMDSEQPGTEQGLRLPLRQSLDR